MDWPSCSPDLTPLLLLSVGRTLFYSKGHRLLQNYKSDSRRAHLQIFICCNLVAFLYPAVLFHEKNEVLARFPPPEPLGRNPKRGSEKDLLKSSTNSTLKSAVLKSVSLEVQERCPRGFPY
ncbi:hypothetical protein CEXT_641201 [Caerostris extrusa]|uniref:Uncharacterized protein n=1 Tax=Caerostris extrusa TaxID=172846 RepID=A0AAV4N7D1_CAEEX|nr:hypothetical protein CEXT_641201 [Caerostris extrusa]